MTIRYFKALVVTIAPKKDSTMSPKRQLKTEDKNTLQNI